MFRVMSALVLVVAATVASAAVLPVHMEVTKTAPAAEAVVAVAPGQLRVWYSQAPSVAISSLILEGPAGRVTLGKVTAGLADGKPDQSLVADITGTMAAGKYTVRWKTSGNDGHVLNGTFTFTFSPAE